MRTIKIKKGGKEYSYNTFQWVLRLRPEVPREKELSDKLNDFIAYEGLTRQGALRLAVEKLLEGVKGE